MRNTQTGVGLIEVMVALLLLTVAVLGYSALQGQAIKATNESFERTQSLVMMRNIAEKIHANPDSISIYKTQINLDTKRS
jgi:type IV pilus assembly protein PilV